MDSPADSVSSPVPGKQAGVIAKGPVSCLCSCGRCDEHMGVSSQITSTPFGTQSASRRRCTAGKNGIPAPLARAARRSSVLGALTAATSSPRAMQRAVSSAASHSDRRSLLSYFCPQIAEALNGTEMPAISGTCAAGNCARRTASCWPGCEFCFRRSALRTLVPNGWARSKRRGEAGVAGMEERPAWDGRIGFLLFATSRKPHRESASQLQRPTTRA